MRERGDCPFQYPLHLLAVRTVGVQDNRNLAGAGITFGDPQFPVVVVFILRTPRQGSVRVIGVEPRFSGHAPTLHVRFDADLPIPRRLGDGQRRRIDTGKRRAEA